MTHKTNGKRTQRAQTIMAARNGEGNPKLVLSVDERDRQVRAIIRAARRRRYAIKLQQKVDRALESYTRRTHTDWTPTAPEAEREKANALVGKLLERAREVNKELAAKDAAGASDLRCDAELLEMIRPHGGDEEDVFMLLEDVAMTDSSRASADLIRERMTTNLEGLAAELHVSEWIENIMGVGVLGLGLIVGEAGPLDNFPNPEKLFKRLGYAPYDGHAGSTWKRESWRPRKLDKEEWIAHPFSGERYAITYTIALWLVNHQLESKEKSGTKHGRPKGPYGEIYVARRIHTDIAHPDWTDGHARADALRVTFKRFLRDLWEQWVDRSYDLKNQPDLGHNPYDIQRTPAEIAAAGQEKIDTQPITANGGTKSKKQKGLGRGFVDTQKPHAEIAVAGQGGDDAQRSTARNGNSKRNGKRTGHVEDAPKGAGMGLPVPPQRGQKTVASRRTPASPRPR